MKIPRANQVPILNLTNLMKKTPPRSEKIVDGIHRGFRFVPNPAVMVFTALFALTQVAGAANLLVNPLFDLTPAKTGWTTFGNTPQVSTNATYYNAGECPPDSPAENVSAYPPGNSNVANVYGNFNAQVNYSGWDQTFAAAPGSTWSAGGWTYASHEDLAGGQNSFYYQVNFKDSGGNTIASFASLIVTNLTCGGGGSIPLDTWVFLPCTNQMQVVGGFANGTVIATYPSGVFTAPPNTAQVTFTALFVNTGYGGGSIYFDDVDLDQVSGFTPPTMSALSPNLITLCTNTAVTCVATSTVSVITNVLVTAKTSSLGGTTIATNTYGLGSPQLSVTGLGTSSASISFTVQTNTIYNSVSVQAADGNNVNAVGTCSFDTLTPSLVIEAADFNFTSNTAGMFIDTPPNGGLGLYANLVGTGGIDENKNPANTSTKAYRPTDAVVIQNAAPQSGGTGIEQKFFTANAAGDTNVNDITEYEVGYNGVGDWLDYSRTYGAGGSAAAVTYNIWCYLATDGSGVNATISRVTSDPTMGSQTTTTLGNIGTQTFTDNGWNTYKYVPMVDQFGNLVSITMTNGVNTLRSTVVGNPNLGFYMLMPVTPILTPLLQFDYPDGVHPFEQTNKFTATVGPADGAAINSSGIDLVLNGADVTSGATITAAGSSWTITYPLALNVVYNGVLSVTNTAALSSQFPLNFDTFNITNYQWEAVDYDFSTNDGTVWHSDLYIDNPVPSADVNTPQTGEEAANSYFGYPAGFSPGVDPQGLGSVAQQGIDFNFGSAGQPTNPYRADGAGTQPSSDYFRPKFIAAQSEFSDPNIGPFNVGYYAAGFWFNYTRDWPTNYFYVWGRLAGGAGPFTGTTLGVVTSGVGTTNQSVHTVGSFADPNAAGWQAWHWIQLTNNGAPAIVPLGGKETLRVTSGNNLNAEFFMLTVAPPQAILSASIVGGQVRISIPTVSGHSYQLLYSASLSPASWSPVGGAITGDGSIHIVNEPATGTQGYYRVSAQ
jgi:hypothetical protein